MTLVREKGYMCLCGEYIGSVTPVSEGYYMCLYGAIYWQCVTGLRIIYMFCTRFDVGQYTGSVISVREVFYMCLCGAIYWQCDTYA